LEAADDFGTAGEQRPRDSKTSFNTSNNPTRDLGEGISMANATSIAYNVASFMYALFALEFGADKFIDHTAIVADRTGIPESIIGLLTAGAE
ncbi:hypothetical protein E4T44_08256, partial [Aureobasidium sp. EXF-8845]